MTISLWKSDERSACPERAPLKSWLFALVSTLTFTCPCATFAQPAPLPPFPFTAATANTVPMAVIAPASPSVTLSWDKSAGTNVTGYKIYWGDRSRTYTNSGNAGTNLTLTVMNLVPGATNYFAATAYDASGLESDFSNEVLYVVPLPPPAPTNLRITLTLQAAASGGGPFIGLAVPPIILTNALAVGQQFYRLKIDGELLP